jgi:GcrA cell cycle regulator
MNLDAKDVALLKKFWAVGQSAAQISRRLGCSRNGLRQANSFGPKAWLQAANIKTQDKAGPEAKAGVVGCLCPPGGKEGGAEDSREAAYGIQQAPALRHAS